MQFHSFLDTPGPRVSFDARPGTDLMARNSLEIHEIRLVVPDTNKVGGF